MRKSTCNVVELQTTKWDLHREGTLLVPMVPMMVVDDGGDVDGDDKEDDGNDDDADGHDGHESWS